VQKGYGPLAKTPASACPERDTDAAISRADAALVGHRDAFQRAH